MLAQIHDRRPDAPGTSERELATANLLRLFGLDRPVRRPVPLVCHWHRDADGRLVAVWEPDIVSERPR